MVWGLSAAAGEPFEAFYRPAGVHPAGTATAWANDAQGIATDGAHWYITQTDRVWRIPVSEDLAGPLTDTRVVRLDAIPALVATGLDHFGDLAWARAPSGEGVLLVPMETSRGGDARPLRLALFRARDLGFLGAVALPCTAHASDCAGAGQRSFGWVAVSPDGTLVSTSASGSVLHAYAMDWTHAAKDGLPRLDGLRRLPLRDEEGRSLRLLHVQGGAFSPSGERLYVAAGFLTGGCAWSTDLSGEAMRAAGGVHVFDTETGRRVRHSTNGHGLFGFAFDPTLPACDEPEGVAIWDFGELPRAPGIAGQLHVLRVSHGIIRDTVSLHHYDGRLYVRDGAAPGGDGGRASPHASLVDALANAWPGARIEWQPEHARPAFAIPGAIPIDGGSAWVSRPSPRPPSPPAVSSPPSPERGAPPGDRAR